MGRTARSRQRESRPKRMLGFSHRPPKSEDAFVTKPERWPFLKNRLIRQSGEVIESGLGNQKLSLFCLHPCVSSHPCAQCVPDSQNKNAGRTRMGTHTRMTLFTDLPELPNEPFLFAFLLPRREKNTHVSGRDFKWPRSPDRGWAKYAESPKPTFEVSVATFNAVGCQPLVDAPLDRGLCEK